MARGTNGSLVDLVRDVLDIQGRVDRNPYATLAGAFGVGFVLGGGLFTRLTERVTGAALRAGLMAALPRLEHDFGLFTGRNATASGSPSEKGE